MTFGLVIFTSVEEVKVNPENSDRKRNIKPVLLQEKCLGKK